MDELTTSRLRLRPLRAADAERIFEIYSHPLAAPWTGEHTLQEIRDEISFYERNAAGGGWCMYGVVLLETGELIGDCGVVPLELVGPELELMYDIHLDYWGRGIAGEAARAVMQHAFPATGAAQLIAVAKPDNVASLRILEKNGFERDGTMLAYGEELLRFVRRAP